MEGRIVTNEQGQKAFWDGKNLTPVRIEPGTTGLEGNLKITDEPARGRIVTNDKGNKAWWDGKNLKPVAAGQADQMQSDVEHSEKTGASLMGTPGPEKIEPIKPKMKRPPGQEFAESIAMPVANFVVGMNPWGRTANAAIGAGMSAVEDISKGKTPSISGMAVGGLGGAIGPEVAKVGKALYRGAAGVFGRGPLKKAGSTIMEETKALTGPVSTQGTEQELLRQSQGFGRTTERSVERGVTDMFDRIAGAKAAGQPLTYGEVFKNARNLNEDIHKLYKNGENQAAGELQKVYNKMMDDMAATGPEAQKAVDSYKRAIGYFGGLEGAKKVAKRIAMYGTGAGGIVAGALASPGSTAAVSVPAALIGGIANLSTRLPLGVGDGIARALITDPGSLSIGAARALAQAINEAGKEGLEY